MDLRRLLLSFVGLALFVLILFGVLAHRIARDSAEQQQMNMLLLVLQEQTEQLQHLLGEGLGLRAIIDHGHQATYAINALLLDAQGTIIATNTDNQAVTAALADTVHRQKHDQIQGSIVTDNNEYIWARQAVPGRNMELVLFLEKQSTSKSPYLNLGARLAVTGFIVIWVAVWGALILFSVITRKTTKLEEDRRRSDEQVRLLLNSTAEAIYGVDAQGNCTFCNPAALRMLGYESDADVLGKNIHQLIHHTKADGSPHPAHECNISDVIVQGQGVHVHSDVFWRADGSSFPVEYRGHPIRSQGQIVGAVVTFLDISEKLKAEQERQKLSLVIEQASDAVFITDSEGFIGYVNPAFETITGYRKEQIIGRHFELLSAAYHRNQRDDTLWRKVKSGEVFSGVRLKKRKDNEEFYVQEMVAPLKDSFGNIAHIVFTCKDISAQLEQEAKIQSVIIDKQLAEQANREKSSFLANMSHELRTPLNAIIGYSEMMYEKAEEIDDRESISDLDKIHSSGEHLLSLVNNILDLSKIEAGKMVLVQDLVNIRETIDAVTATFTPMLAVKGNRLILHIDDDVDTMITDAMRLRQCLFNLLSNAVKFTDNGVITLRVRKSTNKTNSWLIIEVRDTGIGISKENITRIFEAFDRAAMEYSETYGGTGLGLAIVNEIVHMMGGQISVISEPGHGSTFTLQLPYEEIILNTTPPDQPLLINEIKSMIDANGSKPLVLVIDDDPESLGILDWYLKKGGYQVITAENGDFGIRLARELHPVAIILDVLMPKRDGWDVLTELKSDPIMAHIPVIMCTVVDNATKGMALGASDYIVKPINRSLLLKTLKKYCTSETCRILVVDDDDATREMLDRVLTTSGWNVSTATNGSEAITALESQGTDLPDIILLDLMMPELDGYKVVEIVNKTNIWSNIPILIMTAKELTDADYDRLNGSVAGLLEKGAYSVDELLVQLNSLLLRENA